MSETDTKPDNDPKYGYAKFGDDTFMRVSGFVPRLDAGSYKIAQTFGGGILFTKVDVSLDELIVFNDSKAFEIMQEIRRFWALKEMYRKFGIVHKRGFLMYGPPGTGKTSLLYSLGQELADKHDGVTLWLPTGANPSIIGSAITAIREVEPSRAILVVMEDIEIVYMRHESEFLELLDGGSKAEGVAFVGTTNYIANLPPRVRDRPSRFDIVLEIDGPNEGVRAEYLRRKGVPDDTARTIAEASDGLSFAHLKEFVVGHMILGKSVQDVADQLKRQAGIGKSGVVHDEDDEPEDEFEKAQAEIEARVDQYWDADDEVPVPTV